jgi:hypothetical protein
MLRSLDTICVHQINPHTRVWKAVSYIGTITPINTEAKSFRDQEEMKKAKIIKARKCTSESDMRMENSGRFVSW